MASSVFNIQEHVVAAAHIREYARSTSNSQDEALSLCVKQYTPKDNPEPRDGDVTIIGAHANGFPKEVYEPLWEDLHRELGERGIRIRGIWIADAAWQGYSGVLNEGKIGDEPSWLDCARDIIQVINHFRMPRPLIGIGHSFGGNAIANVAFMNPRMFATIVLLDPVIGLMATTVDSETNSLSALSMYRRDVWPSRREAADGFRKSPFYQVWDPRAFDRWVEHGLRDTGAGNGEVTLRTSRNQEVFTYQRPSWEAYDDSGKEILRPELVPDIDPSLNERYSTYPFYRAEPPATVARLPHIRPGVLYVFGDKSSVSTPELQRQKMELTGIGVGGSGGAVKGRVKSAALPDNGHLIPLEEPGFCARVAADWAKGELDTWQAEEEAYREWARKPQSEKTGFGDEFRRRTGKPLKRGKETKAKM